MHLLGIRLTHKRIHQKEAPQGRIGRMCSQLGQTNTLINAHTYSK